MISDLAVMLCWSCQAEALNLKISPTLLHTVCALEKEMMKDCEQSWGDILALTISRFH